MPQHPKFAQFATAFKEGRYGDAITLIDELLVAHPDSAALHWHRANCLEQQERLQEIVAELDIVLKLKADYVPAIVKRVRYAGIADDVGIFDESLSDAERERLLESRQERQSELSRQAEAELRRALALEPGNVDALQTLSGILYARGDGGAVAAEAGALLGQAIRLAPERNDLLAERADRLRSAAIRLDDGADDDDTVRGAMGRRFSRRKLEVALADYVRCHERSSNPDFAVRAGMVLHDLGRYDQALARYDAALAALSPDDPRRALITDIRGRSENNGAGERDQLARIVESAVVGEGKDRSLAEDVAAQGMLAVANAIRAGRPVSEALETRLGDGDDPDLLLATNIAQQILNVAFEPPPELASVDPASFPKYQRRFADKCAKEAAALGFHHMGDAEAKGLFKMLGRHVMLRFFADDTGEIGVAAFAMKPKWPGWIGFFVALLTGKWKVQRMVECITQFADGTHLSTQPENISSFQYGGNIHIELLPRNTPIKRLIDRHSERVAEYQRQHPECKALIAKDIPGVDLRWREGQRVKRAYRASIGFITDDELRKLLGSHYDRFADKVRQQLSVLAADMQVTG
jgi:tetratricopeptide (TPR) repeat protein